MEVDQTFQIRKGYDWGGLRINCYKDTENTVASTLTGATPVLKMRHVKTGDLFAHSVSLNGASRIDVAGLTPSQTNTLTTGDWIGELGLVWPDGKYYGPYQIFKFQVSGGIV